MKIRMMIIMEMRICMINRGLKTCIMVHMEIGIGMMMIVG